MAYHPTCGQPQLGSADLVPAAPVEGFASDVLYRRARHACARRRDIACAPFAVDSGLSRIESLRCRRWYRCHVDLAHFLPPEHIANGSSDAPCCNGGSDSHPDSILMIPNAAAMTAAEFEERCDRPGRPALLGGLTAEWAGERCAGVKARAACPLFFAGSLLNAYVTGSLLTSLSSSTILTPLLCACRRQP